MQRIRINPIFVMSKGNNNSLKIRIMEQKDLVGKRVLVRLGALPRERGENDVWPNPYSIGFQL